MSELSAILAELRAIRAVIERLAPKDVLDAVYAAEGVVEGAKRVAGYGIMWSCGHEHQSRAQAINCLHEQGQMARGEP